MSASVSPPAVAEPRTPEQEAVVAFNRLGKSVFGLQARLVHLEEGIQDKLKQFGHAINSGAESARLVSDASKRDAGAAVLWASLGVCVTLVVGGLVAGLVGYTVGRASGHASGYASALATDSLAVWARGANGQAALALDRNGALDQLARCRGRGWSIVVRDSRLFCLTSTPIGSAVEGWFLP